MKFLIGFSFSLISLSVYSQCDSTITPYSRGIYLSGKVSFPENKNGYNCLFDFIKKNIKQLKLEKNIEQNIQFLFSISQDGSVCWNTLLTGQNGDYNNVNAFYNLFVKEFKGGWKPAFLINAAGKQAINGYRIYFFLIINRKFVELKIQNGTSSIIYKKSSML